VKQSEITLIETVAMLKAFAPIKIIFNDIVLYNDYDSAVEVAPGLYGENKAPLEVIPERLWQAKDYIVTDVNISIVQHHHCIVKLKGRYEPYTKEELT
jgi:hypothetical protein